MVRNDTLNKPTGVAKKHKKVNLGTARRQQEQGRDGGEVHNDGLQQLVGEAHGLGIPGWGAGELRRCDHHKKVQV